MGSNSWIEEVVVSSLVKLRSFCCLEPDTSNFFKEFWFSCWGWHYYCMVWFLLANRLGTF